MAPRMYDSIHLSTLYVVLKQALRQPIRAARFARKRMQHTRRTILHSPYHSIRLASYPRPRGQRTASYHVLQRPLWIQTLHVASFSNHVQPALW